ncbi:MAG: hydroxyisourate hydrolase [Actinomycetota bacterium]|nr:hydroxyisourate hydrolase [Actinomycetota bacterium]
MSSLSTHVLDAAAGRPAAGVAVHLLDASGSVLATVTTDSDGRARFEPTLDPEEYRIVFETGAFFAAAGVEHFYPRVSVDFTVTDDTGYYHVPLLLSPFAYSTYRGS